MGDYRYNPVDHTHNAHLLAGESSVFDKVGIGVTDADQALEVSGIIHISQEQGVTPAAPANSDGGLLYTKADGKPYWRSHDVTETDLSAAGGGSGDITRVNITAGTGLTGSQNTASGDHTQTLALSHLGIQDLTDPGADRIMFWDENENAVKFLVPNDNLAISGTNLNATDTDTNTTYDLLCPSGTTAIRLDPSTGGNDDVTITAGTGITVTRNSDTQMTIGCSVTDTNTTYSAATSSALGLMKLEDDTEQSVAANSVSATAGRTYGVQFNSSDQAVVNVPWTDTNTTYSAATSSALGLMKLEDDTEQSVAANSVSATAGRTYGVQFNSSDQAVVNVPWTDTDTNTTYSAATTSTLGLMKLEDGTEQTVAANSVSTTAGRTYGIQFNGSNQAVVNVPWTDSGGSDTTYDLLCPSGTTAIRLDPSTGSNDDVTITAGTGITVTRNSDTEMTIGCSVTDTNTFRTVTAGGNTLGAGETLAFTAGSGISISETGGAVTITASGGGGGISWDGSTANGVATYKDADEATVEANLTFDGNSMLIVTGAAGSVPLTVKGHASQTADIVKFQKGTSELVVIDERGRLGMFENGSADPDVPLHVESQNFGELARFKRTVDSPVGNAYINVDNTANAGKDAQLRLRAADDGASKIFFGDATDVDVGRIVYDHDDNNIDFFANGSKRFVVRHDAIVDFRISGISKSVSGSIDSSTGSPEINPTEWLTIKVNGNTRYIPVWS